MTARSPWVSVQLVFRDCCVLLRFLQRLHLLLRQPQGTMVTLLNLLFGSFCRFFVLFCFVLTPLFVYLFIVSYLSKFVTAESPLNSLRNTLLFVYYVIVLFLFNFNFFVKSRYHLRPSLLRHRHLLPSLLPRKHRRLQKQKAGEHCWVPSVILKRGHWRKRRQLTKANQEFEVFRIL